MWPIQSLTLLLCLTEDEQLFAQQVPQDPIGTTIEVTVKGLEDELTENDLIWEDIS